MSDAESAKYGRVLEQVSEGWNLQEQQRDQANESMRFVDVPGAQWEGWVKQQFANRPRMEFDKTSLAVNKFNTEWREGRVTVKYRSDDSATSEDDAELLNGLFRKDYRKCNGVQSTDNAVQEMSKGGIGSVKLITDYLVPDDPEKMAQHIKIEPIHNSYNTLVWDPNAKKVDKSDAEWVALVITYSEDAFKVAYPDHDMSSFFIPQNRSIFNLDDLRLIFVTEYYEIKKKKEMAYRYIYGDTGEKKTVYKSDLDEDLIIEMSDAGYKKTSERRIVRKTVEKSILYGGGFLSKPKRIAGNMLPIATCFGYGSYTDGQQYYFGLVEKQKDAQRLLNMAISNMAENAATSPKSMPILTPEQVAGHEQRWAEQHLGKHAYTLLNSVDDQGQPLPLGPIQHVQPAAVDPNTSLVMQAAEGFIQSTTGGMPQDVMDPNASGKAINAVLGQVDLQTGILRDNVVQFFKNIGEIYLGMASEVYDDERFTKVANLDGSDKTVLLKEYVLHPKYDRFVRINDVSNMKLEVTVDVGASFATRKRETVDVLGEMIKNTESTSPYFPLIYGAMIENVEGPGLEIIKKFNRNQMIQLGHQDPETDEEIEEFQMAQQQANQPPPEQAALIENINSQTALNAASTKDKEVEAAKTLVDIEKVKSDIEAQRVDTEAQKIENRMVETGIMELMNDATR